MIINVIYILFIYLYILFIIISVIVIYENNYSRNCISLIVPSTETDFLKCYKQFFYNYNAFSVAEEIVLSISSVRNISFLRKIIESIDIKRKIILGLRKEDNNAASNRNYGFKLSKCNIISYFDMDDIMSNNRLSVLYNFFNYDRTTEFVIHKYTIRCNNLAKDEVIEYDRIKYNLEYDYIYNVYKDIYSREESKNRWCCKYIKEIKKELIHNGWPTMRRYIFNKVHYNVSYKYGQDSDFNSNVILHGYNASILNISLGYYIKDNKCNNYKMCI